MGFSHLTTVSHRLCLASSIGVEMPSCYAGCRCRIESYDECLCRFCMPCGNFGHTSRFCKGQSNEGFTYRQYRTLKGISKMRDAEEREQDNEEEYGTSCDLKVRITFIFRHCTVDEFSKIRFEYVQHKQRRFYYQKASFRVKTTIRRREILDI